MKNHKVRFLQLDSHAARDCAERFWKLRIPFPSKSGARISPGHTPFNLVVLRPLLNAPTTRQSWQQVVPSEAETETSDFMNLTYHNAAHHHIKYSGERTVTHNK